MDNKKRVIVMFFLGLSLMLVLELFLVWVFDQVNVLPELDLGWLNAFIGLLAVLTGGVLVVWSVRVQFLEGKGTPYPKVATQRLVTSGPYAHTRNPMTLGAAIFYLGVGIWAGSIPVIAIVLLIFTGLLRYIYVHETQELAERFGEEYLEYRRKTPFLLPRCVWLNKITGILIR